MSYVKRYERSGYGAIQNKYYYKYYYYSYRCIVVFNNNCALSVLISRTHILFPDDCAGHSLCCTGGWYSDITGQVRHHSYLPKSCIVVVAIAE